ncbi:hypothetical protein GQ53DRAFT_714943 [Thozetella sp. PMI_491]|nr:hypothetical protein GQ53DRAFT_714943 [Thozetella sp. PMI_491]
MRFSELLLVAATASGAAASLGFSSYKEIIEGSDNSDAITYYTLDRSNTIFLYIQIVAGQDHSKIISDFKALANNYGSKGVSVIPRVRYGNSDGSVATEPSDQTIILNDVSTWAEAFANVSGTIQIPVIQAGFLGYWGEWHGTADSATNRQVKTKVVQGLQASGLKVALRSPQDHQALFPNDRSITLHDDCIFDGGPNGYDGGTFPTDDRQTWVDYAKQIASNNTFGGEGCDNAGDATYDWSNWDDLCGSNGLATYINGFQMAYLNPLTPDALQQLFYDSSETACVDAIRAALQKWS